LAVVALGWRGTLARCFSIIRPSAGMASMTFFFAPSRILPYIFFAVACEVRAARASVTDSRSSATSSPRATT
jgi:hypothetical protein